MKVVLLGDCHWGARSDSVAFHKHFDKFYSNVLFPFMVNSKIDHIIQLGDLFDRRSFIQFKTLYRSREIMFDKLKEHGFKMDVFVGNHDCASKTDNEINSPQLLLGEYDNIRTFSDPITIDYDGTPIALLPWVNRTNEEECLNFINTTPAQILMGHLEVAGFEMSRGTIIDHGMDPAIFSKFDMVFSGHYHHKSSRGNIHYTGTPYELTWHDYNDPRGFHVLDTDTREVTFHQNPYRMFHKVFYDDADKTMEQILDVDADLYEGTFIKVIVKNKTNPYWFDMFINKLTASGAVDIQVVEDHLNLDLEDESEILEEAEDTLTILKKVADAVETNVPKKQLVNFLALLYHEAMHQEVM